jgi:hypothetical protein
MTYSNVADTCVQEPGVKTPFHHGSEHQESSILGIDLWSLLGAFNILSVKFFFENGKIFLEQHKNYAFNFPQHMLRIQFDHNDSGKPKVMTVRPEQGWEQVELPHSKTSPTLRISLAEQKLDISLLLLHDDQGNPAYPLVCFNSPHGLVTFSDCGAPGHIFHLRGLTPQGDVTFDASALNIALPSSRKQLTYEELPAFLSSQSSGGGGLTSPNPSSLEQVISLVGGGAYDYTMDVLKNAIGVLNHYNSLNHLLVKLDRLYFQKRG